jgi:hypothetical protein
MGLANACRADLEAFPTPKTVKSYVPLDMRQLLRVV